MNQQQWLKLSLVLSLLLLGVTFSSEALYLNRPFKWTPTLKLPGKLSAADSSYFWDATITGNSKKISKQTKTELKALALAHIYTPSGLHLSLILNPLFLFIKTPLVRGIILGGLFLLSSLYLPGWVAIKRVIEIKFSKTLLSPLGVNSHLNFLIVMLADLAFGTYKDGAMSFCFSFLFLSLLYTKMSFIVGAWWFFIAQIIISIYLEQSFFLTNLLITPILTFAFTLIFPLLLLFRIFPGTFFIGEQLSNYYLELVHYSFQFSDFFPRVEPLPIIIFMIGLILYQRIRIFLLLMMLFSGSLNLGENKIDTNYFLRKYFIVNENYKGCKLEGGFEKCSYRSRSTKKQL